jgi:hypothetical protein
VAGPLTAGATNTTNAGFPGEPRAIAEVGPAIETVDPAGEGLAVTAFPGAEQMTSDPAQQLIEAGALPAEGSTEREPADFGAVDRPDAELSVEPTIRPATEPEVAEATVEISVAPAVTSEERVAPEPARSQVLTHVERPLPKVAPEAGTHAADGSAVVPLREPSVTGTPVPAESPRPPAGPELPESVQQFSQVVVEVIDQGGGEARLHMKPAELGEVTIRLQIDGTDVRLQVHAERPEAMQLLREHRLDLTNLLGDRGLDLSELYVGLGGRDSPGTEDRGNSGPPNRLHGSSEFAHLLGFDPEPSLDNYQRLRAAYNPDGAHVYRI